MNLEDNKLINKNKMNLSKNFTLAELTNSATADKYNIKNEPGRNELIHLQLLCRNILQPIRDIYGKPINVNSGYRCKKLNEMIGGSSTSAHTEGCAADIVPANGNMIDLQHVVLEWAKENNFDQIIIEHPNKGIASWLHIGIFDRHGLQRHQILTYNGKKYANYK